jgi:mono/diheme cytochrome c family protein
LQNLGSMLAAAAVLGFLLVGCGSDGPKTDAELQLNAQQVVGRHVFDQACSPCHLAYSSSGMKGPGLKGLFKKQSLPSGLPVSDAFVQRTILGGRGMMPAFGTTLSQDEVSALMAYLHTL